MSCVSSMRESRFVQSARLGLAAEHPDPYRAAAPTTLTDAPYGGELWRNHEQWRCLTTRLVFSSRLITAEVRCLSSYLIRSQNTIV